MGIPKSLSPSANALRVRQSRERKRAAALEAAQASPSPREVDESDRPNIPGDVSMAEAQRLKAVYDARRARSVAELEELRVAAERGKMWSNDRVASLAAKWSDTAQERMLLVERLLDHLEDVPPQLRVEFLKAARDWFAATRSQLDGLVPK